MVFQTRTVEKARFRQGPKKNAGRRARSLYRHSRVAGRCTLGALMAALGPVVGPSHIVVCRCAVFSNANDSLRGPYPGDPHFYIIESDLGHDLLRLLGLAVAEDKVAVEARASSREEWQKAAISPARRLPTNGSNAIKQPSTRTRPKPRATF